MRKAFLALLFAALANGADNRPRVRAITAFVEVDPTHPTAAIDDAEKFLAAAREAVTKAGFEVGGVRVTTQPFPLCTKGLDREHALGTLHQVGDASAKGKLLLYHRRADRAHSSDVATVAYKDKTPAHGCCRGPDASPATRANLPAI